MQGENESVFYVENITIIIKHKTVCVGAQCHEWSRVIQRHLWITLIFHIWTALSLWKPNPISQNLAFNLKHESFQGNPIVGNVDQEPLKNQMVMNPIISNSVAQF